MSEKRFVALAEAMLSNVQDDDNFSDVFNASGVLVIGFIADYLDAQGQPLTRPNIAYELGKFQTLAAALAEQLLNQRWAEFTLENSQA